MNMGFYDQDEWAGPGAAAFPIATTFKKKNRFKFIIEDISADGVGSLPPSKSGRVGMTFKETPAEHLNETIYFPMKPDWKPISLTLYDIVKGTENPIFSWLKRAYDPGYCSDWTPSLGNPRTALDGIKCAECFLVMYDGCGCEIERWVFEHAWPQSLEFSEGDMSSNDVIFCDVTLRFDRAYIINASEATIDFPTNLSSSSCSVTPAVSMVQFMSVPTAEFVSIRI